MEYFAKILSNKHSKCTYILFVIILLQAVIYLFHYKISTGISRANKSPGKGEIVRRDGVSLYNALYNQIKYLFLSQPDNKLVPECPKLPHRNGKSMLL